MRTREHILSTVYSSFRERQEILRIGKQIQRGREPQKLVLTDIGRRGTKEQKISPWHKANVNHDTGQQSHVEDS